MVVMMMVEYIVLHGFLHPCLFELFLCCSELVDFFVFFRSVKFVASWFVLKDDLPVGSFNFRQLNTNKILMFQGSKIIKDYTQEQWVFFLMNTLASTKSNQSPQAKHLELIMQD
jgi:hypothetical protein